MIEFNLRNNLESSMSAMGLSAAELSRKTGVSKQVISDWRSGCMPRNIKHLYQVARVLDTSIEDLCFGERSTRVPPFLEMLADADNGEVKYIVTVKRATTELG